MIGAAHPCFVIAEIGVNHNGDVDCAKRLVDCAVNAGADAVKFQTFRSEALVSSNAGKAAYQLARTGTGSQLDMLRQLELSQDQFLRLRDHCVDAGIAFMSTAFDAHSLTDVVALHPPCLKWPSGELNNHPFLRDAARVGLPIILSTGMATLAEIAAAVDVIEGEGSSDYAILQCVSNYPARLADQNLRTIATMAAAFNHPTGLSDHTDGPWAAIAARGLGMAILEKHITLDREMDGPDHMASMEPDDFAELVERLRDVEQALGDGVKRPSESESETKRVARKSLFYAACLPEGHVLSETDFTARRPGNGIGPDKIDLLLGRPILRCVSRDSMVQLADVG